MVFKNPNCVCSDPVAIPRYNKTAFDGAGDRLEAESWPIITPPLSVVLVKGWMLGFRPVGSEKASTVDAALPQVDRSLGDYKAAIDDFIHAWLVVEIGDPRWVYDWRLQAERKMTEAGKPGMSDEQVAAFVARYIPAYNAYLPTLYKQGPTTAQPGKTLFVTIDEDRSLVGGRILE